jgi:hypothetical protein
VLTGDEERWANIASLRLFDKPLAAMIEDFERAKGGMAPETLASLIELGREIERADASRATASLVQRNRMTRFQKWVVAVLAIAAAGGVWSTRWVYYDERIGGVTGTATVRVDRWTGVRQVFRCGPVLAREAQEQVRTLQAQLARIVESWPMTLGLTALLSEVPKQQHRVRPCPECPINYDLAPQVASELPFSQSAEVQRLLQRLKTIEAENWHCGWK